MGIIAFKLNLDLTKLTSMRVIVNVCTLIFLGAWMSKLMAQEISLPDGMEKITTVEGITEYHMENGLKVLLFPDPSKPQITVNITYLVGSRHEGYGETGMAHLLEHMVFKGTPNHPDIPAELSEHGAEPNGTTSFDRTNYFETFSASEENLRWALDLEADRMVNSYIAAKDLESEMTVVRNEFESGENSPIGVLVKRMLSSMFSWHNYGNLPIGARADIENVPIERLQAFYRKYYQPDNAVLMVSGQIEEEHTLALVHEYFSKIPKPTRKLFETYTRDPVQDGEKMVTLERAGEVQVAAVAYHIAPGTHPDFVATEILNEVLTNEPSGRMYQALVEKGIANSQFGLIWDLKEPGVWFLAAEVLKDKPLSAVQEAMNTVFEEAKNTPITQEEVDRAKTKLLKDIELAFNDSRAVGTFMSDYMAMGDWRLAYLRRDNLEKVTVDDVQRVANYYLKPTNRTIGQFIPTDEPDRVEIPEVEDIVALVADYKGREIVDQGEAFDPSPDHVDDRTTTFTTTSGMKYALLAKENRGNAVVGRITLRIGDEQSLRNKGIIPSLTASMLDKGAEGISRQEIKDRFDQLKANVSFGGSTNVVTASFETEGPNLREVLSLIGEVLQKPSFSADEFRKLKEEQLAQLEESLSDPFDKARRAYTKMLNPVKDKNHINYTRSAEEAIEALKATTIEDITAFYEAFYGASDATATIVGDFEEDAIKKQLDQSFGNWKSPMPFNRIETPYLETVGNIETINTPDKANAIVLGGQRLPINELHADYPALIMGNYIFGGGFLNSRLATRLRQNDGVSYGAQSVLVAHPIDQSARFILYAIYAPENVDKVMIGIKEELNRVVEEGYTNEELEAAKKGWLQNQNVVRSDDGNLLDMLSENLVFDRNMSFYKDLEEKVANLTLDEVNNTFKKYINYNKIVGAKAGDFEGAKAKMEAAANAEPATMDKDMTAEKVVDGYIAAIGGIEKLQAVKGVKMVMKGEVQGMQMTSSTVHEEPNRIAVEVAVGGNVMQRIVFDGEKGSMSAMGQTQEMPTEMVETMKSAHIFPELFFAEDNVKLELAGIEVIDGQNAYKVLATTANGQVGTSFYAVDSFLKIREIDPTPKGAPQEIKDLSGYQEVNGILFPHAMSISGAMPMKISLDADVIEVNPPIEDDTFKK